MSTISAPTRQLEIGITASAFDAGDWRRDALVAFATKLGLPTRGPKAALSTHIRSQLGRVHPPTDSVATSGPVSVDSLETAHAGASIETHAPVSRPSAEATTASVPRAPDFFKEQPGQTRAQALSAWFASRSVRPQ